MKTKQMLLAISLTTLLSISRCVAYFEPFGSHSDLWDVSQGTIVTSHSAYNTSYPGGNYDARDVFGGAFGFNIGLETGAVIFQDGQPAGFVHSLEWRTSAPITMGSFNFHADEDSAVQRAVARFRLLAKSPGSPTFDLTLYDYTPQQPYNYVDQSQFLLLAANISTVTAQDFRAEFYDLGGTEFGGPRIVELDAFAPVPEPTSLILFAAGLIVIARNRKWVTNK